MDISPDPTSLAGRAAPALQYASGRTLARRRRLGPKAALAFVLLLAVAVAFMLPTPPGRSIAQVNAARCANNLRQIALACIMYTGENGGRYPPTVNDILLNEDITAEVFVCPASNNSRATGPTTQAVAANLTAGGHLSYVYLGRGMTSADPNPATTILAYEPLSNHGGMNVMNVVYVDAHVELYDAKTAQKILAELNTGHNPPRPDKIR